MFTVADCLIEKHNLWLVLVAALVCGAGASAVILLFQRARLTTGTQSVGWHFLTAVAAGASIWCTHFVAILAFAPGMPVDIDPVLTISSLLVAIVGAEIGLLVAASRATRFAPLVGGAIVGLAIAAMHYTGMLAYRVEGVVTWRESIIVASVLLSVLFSAFALFFACREDAKFHKSIATLLLAAAIVGLHFTGMAAIRITALHVQNAYSNPAALDALAIAVASVALVIVGAGLASYFIDREARGDRDRQEAILRHAKELAESSARIKSEFLSNMSHELRTPMHAILNYAGMGMARLADLAPERDAAIGSERARLEKYFGNIQVAGNRLLALLNNLLDLAKLESGKMTFQFERNDLRAVIAQTSMELDPLFKAKLLTVDTAFAMEDAVACFDAPKLMQVMVNLFSNAIKFAPVGSTLHLDVGHAVRDGLPVLRCALTDEGEGIPEGELSQIFESFVQSSYTKSGAGGTGLGLSICQEIIAGHGGRIWAENASELGARILFDLPVSPVALPVAPAERIGRAGWCSDDKCADPKALSEKCSNIITF